MTILENALSQRLTDAVTARLGGGTKRDVTIPEIPGKAFSIIGMRRAGKTTFLGQKLEERLRVGHPRESLILVNLEDDRLAGLEVHDLDWMLEEYFRRYPGLRVEGPVTLALDEVQVVPGWERFVRRVMDTEPVEFLLSGSSARLLSREVGTALRGRALEVLVHPFSFREALRHAGKEPQSLPGQQDSSERSALDHALRRYLVVGGFPEAQGVEDPHDRARLLRSYVDTAVLRDVIERHAVSNPVALRWLQRHLLSVPAGTFSIQKLFHTMRSQGIPVGKDTLHDYLSHLEDSFLVRTVWMHTTSERQRMVNPRKVYPVDPGLIAVYARSGEPETGRALETVVMLHLERLGYELGWVRTAEGGEVDFHASAPGRETLLVQVAASVTDEGTFGREVRALQAAVVQYPEARPLLLTLDSSPPPHEVPDGIEWRPTRWLLGEGQAPSA